MSGASWDTQWPRLVLFISLIACLHPNVTLLRRGSSLWSFIAKTTYHECPQSITSGASVYTTKWHTSILAGQGTRQPEKPGPDPVIPIATARHKANVVLVFTPS